jgi:hypothetical protein
MTATTIEDLEGSRARRDEALHLDLDALESDLPLLTAFIENHFKFSLTAITISAETADMEPDWAGSEILNLFKALASVENLIFLSLEHIVENRFPISLLTLMFRQRRPSLRNLCMDQMLIRGEEEDYSEFYKELINLKNLKEFHYTNVDLYNADLDDDEPVEKLWETLSEVGSLSCLEIADINWEEEVILDEVPAFPALVRLCRSPRIRELNLGKFNLCNYQLLAVATALRDKQRLVELDLDFADSLDVTTSWPLTILTDMLQANCSLERIKLDCSEVSPALANELLTRMANSIARNKNSAVRCIEVDVYGAFHPEVAKAFLDMLKFNYTLEALVLTFSLSEERYGYNGQGTAFEAIRFYLALNQRGRKKLIEQSSHMSKAEWMDVLARYSQDIEFLHYYLKMNPWLFHHQSSLHNKQAPSINCAATRTNDKDVILDNFSRTFAKQMQGMRAEMEKLNSKIDTMNKQQGMERCRKEAEQNRLLEEIQRLKEENAMLKRTG